MISNDIQAFIAELMKQSRVSQEVKLEVFCDQYCEYVRKNRAAKTYEGVKLVCEKLLSFFPPNMNVRRLSLLEAEKFLDFISKGAPKGVYNYHRVLRAMFNKGIDWGFLYENVFVKVKLPKRQMNKQTYVTEDVLYQVAGCIDSEVVRDFVVTAFYTGCRLGELVNLKWNDVDFRNEVITVGNNDFQTKGRKQRVVPMHQKVREVLLGRQPTLLVPLQGGDQPTHLIPLQGGDGEIGKRRRVCSGYVFCKANGFRFTADYFSKQFKRACRAAGVDEGIHFHSIRHGAATLMIKNGATVPAVQRIMGHSNIQTTMVYTHPDMESLRDAVGRL